MCRDLAKELLHHEFFTNNPFQFQNQQEENHEHAHEIKEKSLKYMSKRGSHC